MKNESAVPGYNSMTLALRDYFAAKAMQGLLATPHLNFTADADASAPLMSWSDHAKASFQMADAMLAERDKK